jgi:Leucine-rich repeat (LRR) protein
VSRKNQHQSTLVAFFSVVLVFSFLAITSCNSENNSSPEGSVGQSAEHGNLCADKKFMFPPAGKRVPSFQTYQELFPGAGNAPIPEAEACNSELGAIRDVFPDENLARHVALLFQRSIDDSISQYLLDQVVDLSIWHIESDVNTEYVDKICSLTGLEHFRNLRILYISGKCISNILPLAQMPFLVDLTISGTNVSSLKPLADLEYFSRLHANADLMNQFKTRKFEG